MEYLKRGESIPPDQPSFRYALYYSDVNLSLLPHEYNCMLDYPCFYLERFIFYMAITMKII